MRTRKLNDHEKRILTYMLRGYQLVVGRGLYNYVCALTNDAERIRVARQWFVNLRNERFVAYHKERIDIAVLTERGRRLAEQLNKERETA